MTDNLDANMVRLVASLNRLPGITTVGSCGGHKEPGPGQWPGGTFYLKFRVQFTAEGQESMAKLVWLCNDFCVKGGLAAGTIHLDAFAHEPTIEALVWVIEGWDGADPEVLAELLAA